MGGPDFVGARAHVFKAGPAGSGARGTLGAVPQFKDSAGRRSPWR